MVYFVGAGSGAADLITIRGANLLKKADVIIYAGSLVNEELLSYAKEDCIIHNSAYMTLEEVIKVIEDAEKKGLITVRLHTGDSSIYGAVMEQFAELDKRNISYEVCPGVSSFFGAAASLKTEYTLPGISQSVIITRCEGRTAVPQKERLRDLATHKATMVIFLSTSLSDKVEEELLLGGYDKDTPAAVVYKASWPNEKILRCTVGSIDKTIRENGLKNTSLIIVGDCLGNSFERSKLYDPKFTTEFREGKKD